MRCRERKRVKRITSCSTTYSLLVHSLENQWIVFKIRIKACAVSVAALQLSSNFSTSVCSYIIARPRIRWTKFPISQLITTCFNCFTPVMLMKTVCMCNEYLCMLTFLISGALVLDLYKQPQGFLLVLFWHITGHTWNWWESLHWTQSGLCLGSSKASNWIQQQLLDLQFPVSPIVLSVLQKLS